MHAPANAQQLQRRPGDLRAIPGQRHDADRGGDLRAASASRSNSIRSTSTSPIRRWQAFTGERATLLATGQTFEQVASERERRAGII